MSEADWTEWTKELLAYAIEAEERLIKLLKDRERLGGGWPDAEAEARASLCAWDDYVIKPMLEARRRKRGET